MEATTITAITKLIIAAAALLKELPHTCSCCHIGPRGRSGREKETVDNQTITMACAVWGATVSTILGLVKLWETFWKDRLRLAATYSFVDLAEVADEITVVNLSAVPVQVSHWTLAWHPKFFSWCTSTIDVTPDEGNDRFTIPPKDSHTLYFENGSKFDWRYRTAGHRALYLSLHIFGRRQPKLLKVAVGQ